MTSHSNVGIPRKDFRLGILDGVKYVEDKQSLDHLENAIQEHIETHDGNIIDWYLIGARVGYRIAHGDLDE